MKISVYQRTYACMYKAKLSLDPESCFFPLHALFAYLGSKDSNFRNLEPWEGSGRSKPHGTTHHDYLLDLPVPGSWLRGYL